MNVLELSGAEHAQLGRLAAIGALLVTSMVAGEEWPEYVKEYQEQLRAITLLELERRDDLGGPVYDARVAAILQSILVVALDPDDLRVQGLM